MIMIVRSYSELRQLQTFEERYDYLQVGGQVGRATFGFERYMNQQFYRSTQWRRARDVVISRDGGCDLGIDGFEIYDKVIIHHMNPMTPEDLENGDPDILNPEYLISVTHTTHNAIHFGDRSHLRLPVAERAPGDTKLWADIRRRRDA